MQKRKTAGTILMILGAASIFFSHYITNQVASGKQQIADGQKKVNTLDSLFSINRYTEEAGKVVTEPAKKKIQAGIIEVSQYETLASVLQIGGIVLILAGIGVFFLWKKV